MISTTAESTNAYPTLTQTAVQTTAEISTIRINCGGEQYTSHDGTVWQADYRFESTGTPYRVSREIAQTSEQSLYQTERYGTDLRYSIPVTEGEYTLKLHFAELYVTQLGERIFHIDIAGQRVLSDFDIVAEAGAAYRPIVKTFTVNATGGHLGIDFPAVTRSHWGKVSAIELIPS